MSNSLRVISPADRAPVPPRPGEAIHRVLLATDLSPASDRATVEAFALSRALGAELVIVSVIDPEAKSAGPHLARMDQRRAAREQAALALVGEGRRAGIQVQFLVWEGDPGPAIVDAAAAESADLIVVGTRGRNRVERAVLGSVSDHVIRHAACPVLIVRS
jgi:nucleotide-binding universal stress UspA family protein